MADETVNMLIEVVVLPVADPDRSKAFYQGLGWRLDADINVDDSHRIIQFTPPESPASIQFGTGITKTPPGSVRDVYLIVEDIEAARGALLSHGAQVSDVWHGLGPGGDRRQPGPESPSGCRAGSGAPTSESWPGCCTRRPSGTAPSRRWRPGTTGGTGTRRT